MNGNGDDIMKIKIKYHTDIPKIEKIAVGDWVDLRSAEDVRLNWLEERTISLGISMKLPDGYEAHVAPRSSTFKNWGIIMTNGMGIIDNSYCGDNDIWKFPAYCLKTRKTDKYGFTCTEIKKGDRICQFRIMPKQEKFEFEEVEFLEDTDRGGFGSTGKE